MKGLDWQDFMTSCPKTNRKDATELGAFALVAWALFQLSPRSDNIELYRCFYEERISNFKKLFG
ncbi:MAG: hypothetical protein P8I83_10710 [Paracoccaceae bacterium]|nr:hypothetical protein [Paracoccaceae bacterium]